METFWAIAAAFGVGISISAVVLAVGVGVLVLIGHYKNAWELRTYNEWSHRALVQIAERQRWCGETPELDLAYSDIYISLRDGAWRDVGQFRETLRSARKEVTK